MANSITFKNVPKSTFKAYDRLKKHCTKENKKVTLEAVKALEIGIKEVIGKGKVKPVPDPVD